MANDIPIPFISKNMEEWFAEDRNSAGLIS
jgi:hypothetical protein